MKKLLLVCAVFVTLACVCSANPIKNQQAATKAEQAQKERKPDDNLSKMGIIRRVDEEAAGIEYKRQLLKKKSEEANRRNRDLVQIFSQTLNDFCIIPTNLVNDWILEHPDVVIDKQDFLPQAVIPIVSIGKQTGSKCISTIVVHFHTVKEKKSTDAMK